MADIELILQNCASATESGEFKRAKQLADSAEGLIERLKQLKRDRGGRPRQKLREIIVYYAAWHAASVGRLEITKNNYISDHGFALLEKAHHVAVGLTRRNTNSAEYAKLRRRINVWRLAIQHYKVQPAGV